MQDASLSIAIYDANGYLAAMQRPILRSIGITRHTLVDSEAALLKDLVLGRDVVLLNWSEDWEALCALIRTIRSKATSPDPMVGIVVASAALNVAHVRAALDAGANSLMRVPFSQGDIQSRLKLMATKRWCFIDGPTYFGPDRRAHAGSPPGGVERRVEQCTVLEGPSFAQERERMRSTAMTALEMKVSHKA